MENLLLKSISPQSVKIYNLLIKSGPLSASQIGKRIGIVSNTAYRNLKELIRLGFVQQSANYPAVYSAKPKNEAVGLYTNIIVQNFQEAFAKGADSKGDLKVSFIQNRKELLSMAQRDAHKAKTQINRIISGSSVPAEFTLAFKQAVERGVRVRILVQGDSNKGKSEIIKSWQKMDMEVRYTPNLNTRIVTYDGLITYFASYNPKHAQEAVGVRFEYSPLTALMDEIFKQRWEHAAK